MSKKIYTAAELKEFDKITMKLSSSNQLKRIEGRLAVNKFVAEHGKEKCDAMFEEIKRRDAIRR